MSTDKSLAHRYDFVLVFDVKDGNPNGDPDAGNMPRLDAESGHGLVTDVSLKRKVRNFVGLVKEQEERAPIEGEKRFEIYVREKAILNHQNQRAYSALNLAVAQEESSEDAIETVAIDAKKKKPAKDKRKGSADEVALARQWMCQNFFDVRTFGAVMSTGVNCAKQTGFGEDDLELVFQALSQMFEHDRSAARGEMSTRGLYVFKHDSELGNAPAHALFDRLQVTPKEPGAVARSFDAYSVAFDGQSLAVGQSLQPAPGVTLTRRC